MFKLFSVCFLFLLIYFPPIISINTLHVVGIISIIGCIIYSKGIKKTLPLKYIFNIYFFFILLLIYITFVILYNNQELSNVSMLLFYIVDIIPAITFIVYLFKRRKYSMEKIVDIFLIVGFIQSIIALIMLLNSNVRMIYANHLVSLGYGDVYLRLAEHRLYGIGSNINYSLPIFQSILCSIAIYLAINKKWSYLFFVPFLALSAVLNARTAIVILAIGIILVLLYSIKKVDLKKISSFIIISISSLVLLNILLNVIENKASNTLSWIETGFNEITSFLNGENIGYFQYLTNMVNWIIPEGNQYIFGMGIRIMSGKFNGISSDIGWVNDIWYGGIIYALIIYFISFFIYVKLRWHLKLDDLSKFIIDLVFLTIVIMNFKGMAFSINEVMMFFLIILFLLKAKKNG